MATIVTRVTGATAKNAPLTSAELDQNFINLNDGKLETNWTGSTNLVTLGTVTTGTWNATTIGTAKGGTGLTSFTSGGAVYATSTSALTTGTLPVASGGTGVTTKTGTGSVVLSTSPTLVTPTLGIASATSLTTTGDITVGGNLVVNGTTTTINSTTISVDDKNIELGSVATPTNTTADGGGITLKGATDKTFNWVNATGAWTSSEHIDLAAGKGIYLRGATSGTVVLAVPAAAGATTITFPATTGTVVTTGDIGTVTNTMLAGSIANAKLANSSITVGTTSISLGTSSTTLDGLTSVTSTTFTGALTGNASTATTLATARTIALNTGVTGTATSFDGSANITIPVTSVAASYLSGTIPSTVLGNSTVYIGTSAILLNRASANLALTGISIDGNAGTVTNGVYTNGSYADPAWITSLAKSKVGLGNVENTALSTWAGSANITTIGAATASSLTVTGNLTVNGTTTTINSTTISVDDKNIELGSVATPTNTTADGGGITLKGATDKTFSWVNATSAWTSSEHIALAAGKDIILNGATSGSVTVIVPDAAGTTTITLPATTGTVITSGDTGSITSTMIADGTIVNADINASAAIAVSKLAASTISGITLGNNLNTLTLNVSGTGLSGSTTYNGSTAATFTVTSNATSANTASAIVARDASGNFTAGTITAALTGNASTATTLQTARTINGVSFNGSANITVTADANTLTGTTLKSTVVSSSLTSVGTISTGVWQGTDIGLAYGGTNATLTAVAGGIVYSTASAMAITSAGTVGQVLVSNGDSGPLWVDAGISVADDNTTDASYYPTLFPATSGWQSDAKVSSAKLYFNPSTGTLNSTIFNSLSDATQKTDITKISNATETLSKIDGVEFNWIDNNKHSAGVVAQQLEQFLPFLVDTNENGIKSVNYNGLIAYLIESNKELAKRIEVLEAK